MLTDQKEGTTRMSFGAFARAQREAAGYTQAYMAQAYGYKHASSYAKLERRDIGNWTYPQLRTFADTLNVTVAYLLERYHDTILDICPTCHGSGRIAQHYVTDTHLVTS